MAFQPLRNQERRIRPAPGARLETYDPWAGDTKAETWRVQPPYQALLELIERQPFARTPESDDRLLDWCAENGLLGILPTRAQMVTLPARWGPLIPGHTGSAHLVPTRIVFTRTVNGWRSTVKSTFGTHVPYALVGEPDQLGALVPDDALPAGWPRAGAILQQLGSAEWEAQPLEGDWAAFFPDVEEGARPTYDYAQPFSQRFWELYAEPVEEFLNAAVLFRDALRGIGTFLEDPSNVGADAERRFFSGRDRLHALVARVSPYLQLRQDASLGLYWVSTSLLSTYAMMAIQDLAKQRRPRSCEACGRIFLSAAYQARYCSETCRHRAQKRRQRAGAQPGKRNPRAVPRGPQRVR